MKLDPGALEKTWQPVDPESAAGSFAFQHRVVPTSRPDRFVERAGKSAALHFRHNPRPYVPLAWLSLLRRSHALTRMDPAAVGPPIALQIATTASPAASTSSIMHTR